jgi:hypothetical protein
MMLSLYFAPSLEKLGGNSPSFQTDSVGDTDNSGITTRFAAGAGNIFH